MTEKELLEKWATFVVTDYDKSLFIEYAHLCNFISDEDFHFYLHPDEATEAQFLSVLDFLHHQGCYMLLCRFLRDNEERLIFPDFGQLKDIKIREDMEERFKRFYL